MVAYIIDLSNKHQVEQCNTVELDYLEKSILESFKGVYNIEGIYIVGSFCFGFEHVNDIDVCVMIPEDESYIVLDEPTGDNVYYMCEQIISGLVSRKVNREISLLPHNHNDFLTNAMQDVNPPMYDLTNRIWLNKQPLDKWNYYMLRQGKHVWTVERDSEEGKRIGQSKH